jgi:hypothetical protein
MAVLGLITRSTIASLLLTIMFWVLLFLVNQADGVFIMLRESAILRAERLEARIVVAEQAAREELEVMREEGMPTRDENGNLLGRATDEMEVANPMLRGMRESLEDAERGRRTWTAWAWRIYAVKTALPKTVDTINLLDRYLLTDEDRARFRNPGRAGVSVDEQDDDVEPNDPVLQERMIAAFNSRTQTWIIGTSLAFEAVVLGFGAWRFSRRDF